MNPWKKAYAYGLMWSWFKTAHVVGFSYDQPYDALCGIRIRQINRTPKPYPTCKNCLRTKRAKELGLLDRTPNLWPVANSELP